MTLMTCAGCAAPLASTNPRAMWCSDHCRKRIGPRVGFGSLPPDDDHDIETYVEQRTYLYVRTCLLCGREQRDPERMTRKKARMWRVSGLLGHCSTPNCGGSVHLDELDIGHLGSPQLVKNTWGAHPSTEWKTVW